MNIFATDADPIRSAMWLDDKRGRKMILESAQIIATNLLEHGVDLGYRKTHYNHPCTVWARLSSGNARWLYQHVCGLAEAHRAYSGKYHASYGIVRKAEDYLDLFPDLGLTPFVNCTTDFKHIPDVHLAYKMQMNAKWLSDLKNPKKHLHPTWKLRETPEWAYVP